MDAFLTLFLAQLNNQDPTNPMESYELASQLAQFSTVEQLSTLNTEVASLESYLTSICNEQLVDMVGKQVTGVSDALKVKDGDVTACSYTLDSAASDVTVKIYDSDGDLVTTLSTGAQDAGTYSINWDGTDSEGNTVADGDYTCAVQMTDTSGAVSDLTTTVSGVVYSFIIDDGTSWLVLDNADGPKLSPSYITAVSTSSSTSSDAASAYSALSSLLPGSFSASA
jgi:flagellar basal-body rod modification protein FlgD